MHCTPSGMLIKFLYLAARGNKGDKDFGEFASCLVWVVGVGRVSDKTGKKVYNLQFICKLLSPVLFNRSIYMFNGIHAVWNNIKMNQRGCVWVQTYNESTFQTSPITVMLAGVQSSSLFSVSWHWLLVLEWKCARTGPSWNWSESSFRGLCCAVETLVRVGAIAQQDMCQLVLRPSKPIQSLISSRGGLAAISDASHV